MSTKIYNGMTIPLNKLETFIKLFNQKSIKGAQKAVKDISKEMSADRCKKIIKKEYNEDVSEDMAVPVMVMHLLIQSSKKSESGFNVDVWFNAWVLGNRIYLYTPSDRFVPTAKDFPSWCKDFSYWNNTDPDKNVSNKEWDKRFQIWDSIMDGGEKESLRITHVVIEAKDIMNKGILQVFPNINREKMFQIHSVAYLFMKEKVDKGDSIL